MAAESKPTKTDRTTTTRTGSATIGYSTFYLRTQRSSSYAMLHRPSGTPSGVAVLMCPSYGWNELCINRVKFRWACELAAAGHTVLRFDLPGTGDSSGQSTDPDQLGAWLETTRAAAEWLRADGARRIVGFGVEFGALLAWLATAEGAPIDDLMLWRVPRSGRRIVRTIQAAAKIGFATDGGADPRSGATGEDGSDLLHGGFIEESGQIMTGETMAALSHVDLTKHPLTAIDRRRILMFIEPDIPGDNANAEWLRGTGADLELDSGEEFSAMMRYVVLADPPLRAISTSAKWLSKSPAEPVLPVAEAAALVASDAALELDLGTAHIRDRPVTIPVLGYALRGIVSEPASAAPAPFTVVYFCGSADRRIGPNRAWVDASRRWAARGVRGVRIDLQGIGDSDGADDTWRDIHGHFRAPARQQVVALLDALQNRGFGQRFLLVGFCASAVKSLEVSFTDRRVVGVFLVNPPFLLPSRVNDFLLDWWVHDWEPKPTTTRPRELTMRVAQQALSLAEHVRRALLKFGPRRIDVPKHKIWQATARGTQYVFLISTKYRFRPYVVDDPRSDRLTDLPQIEVDTLPDNDARFRTMSGQRFVNAHFDAMLERLLASNRS